MINALYLKATLQDVLASSANLNSVFLRIEIASGDIFQMDDSILQKLCDELKDGVGLTECGRTEDVLPYGRSRYAKIESGCLSTMIEICKRPQIRGTKELCFNR